MGKFFLDSLWEESDNAGVVVYHLWLFVLFTAFLTMQWTAVLGVHVHLAEHHVHNGSLHQHNIEIHAHKSINHHAETIDSSHTSADSNFVDIDQDCNSSNGKYQQQSSIISVETNFLHFLRFKSNHSNSTDLDNSKASFLSLSIINLRAPPQFS